MATDLSGKIAIVTGGNSGIGKETAAELAQMGAHVVIAARNPTKAANALEEIRARTGAGDRVETMPIDLASFASVRDFVERFNSTHDRVDILVNNAGLMLSKRVLTTDGHESQFQINHLSHFLLTNLLHDRLRAAGRARVVSVASDAHRFAFKGLRLDDLDWEKRRYFGFMVYSCTKLMNIMFVRELAKRWVDDPITANAVHPGFVRSNFAKEGDYGVLGTIGMTLGSPFAISVEKGARTSVYCASSPEVADLSGQFFAKCRVHAPTRAALDEAVAKELWDRSAEMTGIG